MSEDNNQQQPQDLQDLFRMAIQQASSGDQNQQLPSTNNDEDPAIRMRFLQQAIASLTESPVDQLKKAIEFVERRIGRLDSNESSDDPSELIDEIERCVDNVMMDIICQVDFANDFYKMGGLELVKKMLSSDHNELKIKSYEIIAETVQNNPTSQEVIMSNSILDQLIHLLDDNSQDQNVRVKSLYAISALIRENSEYLNVFDKNHDGYSVLLRTLQSSSDSPKLKIKICFLLTHISATEPNVRQILIKMGLVEQLVALLYGTHDESHEHVASALHSLISNHDGAKSEAKRPEFKLKQLLQQKLPELDGKEEFLEELTYCKSILNLCFDSDDTSPSDGTSVPTVDR